MGGWNPYLFNQGRIKHPGTKDVDLLFADGVKPGELREVFQAFLKSGFFPSAKHEFQLLRVLNVNQIEFIFNVDFLHPAQDVASPDFFVDHLELPVPLSEYSEEEYYEKSIPIPYSNFIFEGFSESHTVHLPDINGIASDVEGPFPTESAFIVSKTGSVGNLKRKRDPLDIFMTIDQSRDRGQMISQFRTLFKEHRSEFNTLYKLKEEADKSSFINPVMRSLEGAIEDGYERYTYVNDVMRKFYEDINMPEKALAPWP